MASDLGEIMHRDNPVFAAYAFYSAILILKMFATAILTGRQRMKKGVFANPEDVHSSKDKVTLSDPDVERVRRAHLNDLENIPSFLFIAFLYMLTEPSTFLAVNLIRAFVAARILHTFVYAVVPLPQPSRALCFIVGVVVTSYMAVSVMMHFCECLH